MASFLADIKEALWDEIPEAVKITSLIGSFSFMGEDPRDIPIKPFLNQNLSWEQAQPLLDYKYDPGYVGVDCHFLYIWTKDSVFYIHEYDGSTSVRSVPRNP